MIYLAMFCFWFLVAYFIKWDYGDDMGFLQVKIWDLGQVLPERYATWTSRVVIETFVAIFATLPKIFWCGFLAGSLTYLARSIAYLFTKDKLREKIISAVAMNIFPLIILFTAGWFNTTIFYLLPMVCMVTAFYPIKWMSEGKKIKWWQAVIAIIATMIAGNWEQTLAIMAGFFIVFLVKFWREGKKNWLLFTQIAVVILSAIFILTCPGNGVRMEAEMSWFPGYENFSVLQKLMMGVNGIFSVMMYRDSIIYLALTVIIALALWKNKQRWVRIISKVPAAYMLVVILMHHVVSKIWSGAMNLKIYSNIVRFNGTRPNLDLSVRNVVLTVISFVVLICILVSLAEIFKKKETEKWLMPLIFLAGFLSVLMVAFSPTFYGSNVRIYAFLDFMMVILMAKICADKPKWLVGGGVLCVAAVLQIVVQILAIFFGRMYTI